MIKGKVDANTKATNMELDNRGLPRQNFGLPSLDLDQCQRTSVPTDWDVVGVFGDIIMCKYVDENKQGEVLRNGIWLRKEISQYLWRVVEVMQVGPEVPKYVNVGDTLMIPQDRGIGAVNKNGDSLVFINVSRVFAKVTPTTK